MEETGIMKHYLDETGLADVASHVNTRLKTVTTMPETCSEGSVRLYVGETSGSYIKGHIYEMKPTTQNFLMFSADTSTYFMSEDGTITDVAPSSYSPQISDVPFTDPETGATLVYMAGNNALVQKLGSDVNVITISFNKIKASIFPWWTAGASTGSYNPFTIRNVALVAVTAWVDITPSGSIISVESKSDLNDGWIGMPVNSTAIINVTTSFALTNMYNIPTGRHFFIKGGELDKSTLLTNDGKKFSAQYITDDLVFTELNDEQTLKYDTLPDASTIGVGKIALYNGPDTASLIHGHFYEVKSESGIVYVPTTDTEPEVSEYGFYDGSTHWITFASSTPSVGDRVLSSDDATLVDLDVSAVSGNTVTVNGVDFTLNADYDKFIQYYTDAQGTPYTEPLTHASDPSALGLYVETTDTIYVWEECTYGVKIWKGSEADWDLLPISEKIKYDYVVFDEEDNEITAGTIPYDNTDSGLVSTNVQGAIDETQNRITAPYVLQGRRFICIGDSYSIGQNPEHSTDGRGWCYYLRQYLNIPVEDFFMPTAADVGSLPGFYPTAGTHKSFKDQLITMESYVDDLSTITDIVVAGGYNDAVIDNQTLVRQGFGDFIEHVNETFSNVNVWVGCIGATTNLNKAGFNLALQIPYLYSKSCISQINSSSVGQRGNKFRYLDNCESAFRYYKEMSTDKIHPTELGYNILSYTLASAIKGYHGDDMFYGWLYEDSNYDASDFGTTEEHWFKNAFAKDPSSQFNTKYGTTMIFEQIKNNMAFLTVTFGAINNPAINNWEYPQEVWWISNSGLSIKTQNYFEVLKFTSGLIIPTGWSECEVVVPAAFYTEWSNGTNRLEQVLSGNYIISNQGVKVQLNATHITNQIPEYKLVLISMSGFSCTFPATFA